MEGPLHYVSSTLCTISLHYEHCKFSVPSSSTLAMGVDQLQPSFTSKKIIHYVLHVTEKYYFKIVFCYSVTIKSKQTVYKSKRKKVFYFYFKMRWCVDQRHWRCVQKCTQFDLSFVFVHFHSFSYSSLVVCLATRAQDLTKLLLHRMRPSTSPSTYQ